MSDQFDLYKSALAMCAYTRSMAKACVHAHRAAQWDDSLVPAIETMREAIRIEQEGGGMCHLVSEWLWDKYGWERLPVTYLDPHGRVICAGHLINALPDGSLLDSTADQFGEGHSVRVLRPGDPDYGRYRPEFDEEVNPVHYGEFQDFWWDGSPDFDNQDKVRAELGYGWWLKDTTALLDYLRHQVSLGGAPYGPLVLQLEQRFSRD